MNGFAVRTTDLSVRFGDVRALERVSVDLPGGSIAGLLGRNGSGKTTLLSTVAALREPSSGAVLVDGEDPFENERVMEGICLVRESGDVLGDERISTNLDYFQDARPRWDADYAGELLDAFSLSRRSKVGALSRGQRSAFGAVIGLASRAPLTIFDEVHLGMDAPSRQRFHDLLLADYVAHPRTVVLSSHLIAEVEPLLERVVVLSAGRLLLSEEADALRTRGTTLTGHVDAVDTLTRYLAAVGVPAVASHDLGRTRRATVIGDLDPSVRDRADDAGVELGPVALQDLFTHLTEEVPS